MTDQQDNTEATGDATTTTADRAHTERLLAEAAGWRARLPLFLATVLAGAWIAAVAIGHGERQAARDLAAMPSPVVAPGPTVSESPGWRRELPAIARELEEAELYDYQAVLRGVMLWELVSPDDAAVMIGVVEATWHLDARLDAALLLEPGDGEVNMMTTSMLTQWLCWRLHVSAMRRDWPSIDRDWQRLTDLHTLLRQSQDTTVRAWMTSPADPPLQSMLRIVERYGHEIPADQLLRWRRTAASVQPGDWWPVFDDLEQAEARSIAETVVNRENAGYTPNNVTRYAPLLGNQLALSYRVIQDELAPIYDDTRGTITQTFADGQYTRFRMQTAIGAEHLMPFLNDYSQRWWYEAGYSGSITVRGGMNQAVSRLLLLAAIDAILYQREHGVWPPTAASMNAECATTPDPFDPLQQPLQLRVDAAGVFRFYSLGTDGEDNSGLIILDVGPGFNEYVDAGLDVGLRLVPVGWRPAGTATLRRPAWIMAPVWPTWLAPAEVTP